MSTSMGWSLMQHLFFAAAFLFYMFLSPWKGRLEWRWGAADTRDTQFIIQDVTFARMELSPLINTNDWYLTQSCCVYWNWNVNLQSSLVLIRPNHLSGCSSSALKFQVNRSCHDSLSYRDSLNILAAKATHVRTVNASAAPRLYFQKRLSQCFQCC